MSTKVLLDANTLVSQHFLKGHLGVALVFALRRMHARLVVPESTLGEAKQNALRLAEEHRLAIDRASGHLQVLLGRRPSLAFPPVQEVERAINEHISAIGDIVEHCPLELTSVRSAIKRVTARKPPSHAREEFRDALFWEVATVLARADDVHMVTEDGDFLVGKGAEKVLHPDLIAEIQTDRLRLQHHLTLAGLLTALGPEAQRPDVAAIASAVGESVRHTLQAELSDRGVIIQQQLEGLPNVFATADPNALAISFVIGFQATSSSSSSPDPAPTKVRATGNASLDPRNNRITSVDLERVDVESSDGGHGGIVYLRTGQPSETSWRPYEFRHRLG